MKQEISVDKYVIAYMAEAKEKELVKNVLETHETFNDWRKKQKHLLLGCEIEGKVPVSSKKEKEKEKEHPKVPIPFPPDCIIPVNAVWSSLFLSRVATRVHAGLFEEGGERMRDSLRCD